MDRATGFIIVFIAVFIWGAVRYAQAAELPLPEHQEVIFTRISPFLTIEEERSLEKQSSTIPITYLKVTAIFYSQEAEKSRAIIEGRVVSIGDTIDNKKIVMIHPEELILKDSQGYYVVRMSKIALSRHI